MNTNNEATHWFFEPLPAAASASQVWPWWEKRRLGYNIVVVATAFFAFWAFQFLCATSGLLRPGDDAEEPMAVMLAMFVGPLTWNLGYCLGPILDLALRRWKAEKHFGPLLLKFGTVFSMAVVSLPALIWLVIWIWQATRGFPHNYSE